MFPKKVFLAIPNRTQPFYTNPKLLSKSRCQSNDYVETSWWIYSTRLLEVVSGLTCHSSIHFTSLQADTSKRQDLIHLDRYLIHAWAVASKFNTGGSAVLGSSHIRVLNSDPNVLNLDVWRYNWFNPSPLKWNIWLFKIHLKTGWYWKTMPLFCACKL